MPSPKHRNRTSSASQHSITGAAIRRGELKISDPVPFDISSHEGPPCANFDMPTFANTPRQPEATWSTRKDNAMDESRSRFISVGHGDLNELSRASVGPSLLNSSLSTGPSKQSLAQRKNSGFRATLRRMFGSKRSRSSFPELRDYHQSDPGNLTCIVEKQTDRRATKPTSQRAAGVTRASALGSHLPNSEMSNPPRTSSERNKLKTGRRRRRNTLPSLILTEQEAQILAGPKDDLSMLPWKRPAQTELHLKRRSRSADALNDLVTSYASDNDAPQDRASQIAYWRTSVIDDPPPMWTRPGAENQHDSHPSRKDVPELAPVQTFDFGLTKAETEPATLEERVNTLEVKLFDFEFAIAKLQGHDIPKPMLYHQPHKRRSIHDLFPDNGTTSTLTSSSSSHREPTSFLTSPDESPIPSTEQDENSRPDRTSKATTIRPLTARRRSSRRSHAPSPSPVRISHDQFDALMNTLKEEQTARKRLEVQVGELQKELDAMRTPVYAEIRPYPTPSPESPYQTPLAPRGLKRSPKFAYEKTPQSETSRFSTSEADTDTEDGFQDVYETPQENKHIFDKHRGSPLVGVS